MMTGSVDPRLSSPPSPPGTRAR